MPRAGNMSFLKRIRVRDIMSQMGIARGTTDFYEALDNAVAMAVMRLIDDLHMLYPGQTMTSDHIERVSSTRKCVCGRTTGYTFNFEKMKETPDIDLSDDQLRNLKASEVEDWE